MSADLPDLTSLHHNDLVSVSNCRETMRYNNSGNVPSKLLPDLIYRCLDLFLIGLIKSRSSFIQEENLGLLDKCAGNG